MNDPQVSLQPWQYGPQARPAPDGTRRPHSRLAPLSYERMAILLAVAAGPIDRARIPEAVLADTVGAVIIRKTTGYTLIKELTAKGYLQVRGSYTLTDKGWRTLHREHNRMENQRLILKQRLHV